MIPAAALVREDGHDFVVLVEADNRVRRQALSLGERLGDRVVVLDGLPQGARFVLRGGSFLQDGDVVLTMGAGSINRVAQALSQLGGQPS